MADKVLFPTIDVPGFIAEKETYERAYQYSLKWDARAGDFVCDGTNRMAAAEGIEAYKVWCIKMSQTERYACMAYPRELGVEMEQALKEPAPGAVESAVERTITEALLVNPRTEYVRGFTFEWQGDSLRCAFTVKGIDWEEFSLQVQIQREVK